MPDRADIYLICGATGAGKSTHAETLAQRVGGVRFSIDEWMQRLHNQDKPDSAEMTALNGVRILPEARQAP